MIVLYQHLAEQCQIKHKLKQLTSEFLVFFLSP